MQTVTIHRYKQQGVTLVEMMIAMVISLILMAGVYQTYLGSKQAYRTQDGLSRLQENARFAMDQLTRDIRMANNFGCVPGPINQFGEQVIFDRSGGVYNYDPNVSAQGGIIGGPGGDGSDTTTGDDSLTIRGVGGLAGLVSSPVSTTAGTVVTLLAGATLPAVGDNVVISDCLQAEIAVVGAVNNGANTVTLPGIANSYTSGAMVYPVQTIVYSIQTGAGGQDGLFRAVDGNAQEIAEGVDSIDFLYREVGSTAFTLSSGVTDWNNIDVVRINLLFSTPNDNIATAAQTYNMVSNDGTAINTVTAGDRRLRRMMSALVDVRK